MGEGVGGFFEVCCLVALGGILGSGGVVEAFMLGFWCLARSSVLCGRLFFSLFVFS